MCQETTEPDLCAGQEIYLVLKFNKENITIIEKNISSCKKEEINYKWELIGDNEIKIWLKPEEIKYKSIENMKFKTTDGIIIGYKMDWNNKKVEYVFNKLK